MSIRTYRHSTSRTRNYVSVEHISIVLGVATLVAIYGWVTLGLVSIGLAPTFAAWLLAIAILGGIPVTAVWLVSRTLELIE